MSRIGTSTSPARRLLAASVPYTSVKISEATIAASIRSVVRIAYSGRFVGSSEIACVFRVEIGAIVSWKPIAAIAMRQMMSGKATKSQRLGSTRHADALAVRFRLKLKSIRRPSCVVEPEQRQRKKPHQFAPDEKPAGRERRSGRKIGPESGIQAWLNACAG